MSGEQTSGKQTDGRHRIRRRRSRGWQMVRDCLPPAAVLLAIPAFCLWHGRALSARTERWLGQLDAVERYARAGQWAEALSALEESRADWSTARTYLQITVRHDGVDGADALYERCAARTGADLLPELADLRRTLGGLSDRERLSLGNIF